MPILHFTTHINGPAEAIFALITDLPHYDRWLPRSSAFGAVTQLSSPSVALGTTYVDVGPSGAMHGSVTEYEPSKHIAFQQSMPLKLLVLRGTLDISMRYTLEPQGQATLVKRDVTLHVHGTIKVAQAIVVATTARENRRVLKLMKDFVEAQSKHGDA